MEVNVSMKGNRRLRIQNKNWQLTDQPLEGFNCLENTVSVNCRDMGLGITHNILTPSCDSALKQCPVLS